MSADTATVPARDALDTLAMLPVEELRRLAHRLDAEQRIIRALLRERTRRPERGLSLVGDHR